MITLLFLQKLNVKNQSGGELVSQNPISLQLLCKHYKTKKYKKFITMW